MMELLFEHSALILTGIFIAFISSLLYSMNVRGFIAGGRYRKKEEAVVIYIAATFVLGIVTPYINEVSMMIIGIVPALAIVGILIVGANFTIHRNIPRWKQTSMKSLLIYLLGVLLIVVGFLHIPEKLLLP